jgi:hypothetical protein
MLRWDTFESTFDLALPKGPGGEDQNMLMIPFPYFLITSTPFPAIE